MAKELLGNHFVHQSKEGKVVGKIVETEAYSGIDDLACHASRGITPRTKTLFQKPGQLYVYLNYGIFWLTNIVSHETNNAGGILIRSAEIVEGEEIVRERLRKNKFVKENDMLASGPGKFSVAFGIDGRSNEVNTEKSTEIYLESCPQKVCDSDIIKTVRVGVDYAKHCKDYPWRFYIKNNKFVSRP